MNAVYRCGMWAGAVIAGVLLSAGVTLAGILIAGRIQHG